MNSAKNEQSIWSTMKFGFIPAKFFIPFFVIITLSIILDAYPGGFLGGFVICTMYGVLLDKIGNETPFVKTYLGGGAFVAIFGGGVVMYLGLFPDSTLEFLSGFIKSMDYIGLAVGALICGSILSMNRKVLIKAGSLYFIPILAGIVAAFLFTGVMGQVLGYGWKEAILYIALPIMGGGTSAGAVPMSETYAAGMLYDSTYYLSLMMPAVVIGNAMAIVLAGIIHSIGKKFPKVSGNGNLMRDDKNLLVEEERVEKPISLESLAKGLVLTGIMYAIGIMLASLVPSIHYYAWTIVTCAICKISGVFPEELEEDIYQWYLFVMKSCVPAVLFGIGLVYMDLGVVIASLSVTYLLLVIATLVGAMVGTWFVGQLIGFYPIECTITAGLCMANMGGSGDIATLGAANRMELMPFAQISSRIGGALIIVIASVLVPIIGIGL